MDIVGYRKLIFSVVSLLAFSALCWGGKLTDGVYETLMQTLIIVFMGANSVSKFKDIGELFKKKEPKNGSDN